MFSFILGLVVLGLIWYLVLKFIPLPEPVKTVLNVVFILILIFAVLQLFGLLPGSMWRFPR